MLFDSVLFCPLSSSVQADAGKFKALLLLKLLANICFQDENQKSG